MTSLSPKRERTREELVEAARRMIGRKGLLATTINDIAAEAGRAAATLYLYFPSKLDLAYELARQFDSEAAHPAPNAEAHDRDGREEIRDAVEQFWRTFAEQRPVAVGAYQLTMVEPAFAEEWTEIRRAVTRRFTRAIRRLQQRGEAAKYDPVRVASAISGMLWHAAIVVQYCGQPFGDGSPVDTLAEVWHRAVTRMPAS